LKNIEELSEVTFGSGECEKGGGRKREEKTLYLELFENGWKERGSRGGRAELMRRYQKGGEGVRGSLRSVARGLVLLARGVYMISTSRGRWRWK
jgi:hypothetical protein